mgnify:CR=1 FL=1
MSGAVGNLGATGTAVVAHPASKKHEIPAHRVVNKKGLLTGKHHFQGTSLMQQLLESEGIQVVDFQIQNLETHFWDPQQELPPEN